MDSIRRLNNTLQKQQGRMSPNSNGNGHGKLLKRTMYESEAVRKKLEQTVTDALHPRG